MTDMTSWLASLDEAELERVLSRRTDATTGSIPRTLDQLAQRMGHPHSVAAVLDAVPTPLRQVAEALLALSEPRTETALRDLLERYEPDHDAAVTSALQNLYDCAIAWPDEDGSIGLAAGLTQVFPRPLGLGPPLRSVLGQLTGTNLRRALKHLGDPQPPARREDAAAALYARLSDPAAVRGIVAAAPTPIAEHLYAIARPGMSGNRTMLGAGAQFADRDLADGNLADGDAAFDDAFGDDAFGDDAFGATRFDQPRFNQPTFNEPSFNEYGSAESGFGFGSVDDRFDRPGFGFRTFDHGRFAQRYEAENWAVERGLLASHAFGAETVMPAEIAVALRGNDYRAPFAPYPPPIPATAVDPNAVETSAAAAATDFAGQAVSVLDLIARAPLTQLKSGGVGARELARVAKTAGIDEAAARLAIELAAELGLLVMDAGFLRATEAYAPWRELEPAAAYATLLNRWLTLPFTPTATTDFEGRTIRLLHRHGAHDGAVIARDVLLTVLASLPPGRGTTRAGVAPALLWSRPRSRELRHDRDAPYATVWAEADRLGVIAVGALSRIGRAMDDRDGPALVAALHTALPANTDTARFGSDLTVLVAGSPSARVSSLLDAAADRESRGAGVTWRFSPASVRRAFDDGADPDDLLSALEAIAVGELPQPLRYLVNDVARRHGEVQVSTARTVVRGADAALLAQVAADRALRGLGLRLVAPTVLTSAKSEHDTLLALRAAGYLPVPEPSEPSMPSVPSRTAPRASASATTPMTTPMTAPMTTRVQRPPSRPAGGTGVSAHALAVHLLSTHSVSDPESVSGTAPGAHPDPAVVATERVLGRLNPHLTADEIRQLADAVDTGGPVSITYESTSGARTTRVISDAKLGAGMLTAWCFLRNDERFFLVDRILSVTPGSP